MSNTITSILKVAALGLLALALVALISACNSASGGSDDAGAGGGDADAAEHVDDGDADADVEEHEEENGDLETAPKDVLTLVEMTSFAYAPDTIEVGAGEVLEVAIQNVEPLLHDFTIDKIDADVHVSYLGGTGQHEHQEVESDADVHFALTEPASGVVHLKVHEPGEYVFYCTVPGHLEAGMVGTLIVQ